LGRRTDVDEKRERALALQLGHAIAKERALAGLTQEQVAEALTIGKEAVSRIERGVTMPTVSRLVEFSELFGCPFGRFLQRVSESTSDYTKLIESVTSGLSKKDKKFVLELVELACNHLHKR
jgi:transcriptional regulator with XRE-family HTH domain